MHIISMDKVHYVVLIILTLGFFGCSSDNPVVPQSETLKFEGKVFNSTGYTDTFESGAAVKGAVVDVYGITSDGREIKINKNSVSSGSDGKFIVSADVFSGGEFLVIARKGNKVWKAVVTVSVYGEVTIFIQPLTEQSTAQAEVFINARKKGYQLSLYDISLYVTPEISEIILDNHTAAESVSRMLNLAVSSRTSAFLSEYFNGQAEAMQNFYSESERLHINYARDLHFCSSESAMQMLENNFYESYIDALTSTGLTKDKIMQLLEIEYMVLIKSSVANEELMIRNIKSAAKLKAIVNNRSNVSDFQYLKGTKKINEIKSAASVLLGSIKNADNYEKVKSAFKKYNDRVLSAALNIAGVNGSLKGNIEIKIMSGLHQLIITVNSEDEPGQILNAYILFYSKVSTEVKFLLKNVYNDDSSVLAALIILTYLNY